MNEQEKELRLATQEKERCVLDKRNACAQGIVVWVPIWRGLALQTLPFVSADRLTKPQTTSFSPAQNMPRDVS